MIPNPDPVLGSLARPVPGQRPENAVAAPVRVLSVGLGAFSRAHPGWYTAHAPDAGDWGIAAFTGRRPELAAALACQDGLYTLVTRGPDGDGFEVMASISVAHAAADHEAWLRHLAAPATAVVLLTVTEAGYRRDATGGLDRDDPAMVADLAALRADATAPVTTAPAKLVAGLAARRRADAGPLAIVACDNLAGNGAAAGRVLADLAAALDPELASWVVESVSFVSTVADRITPASTAADIDLVAAATGVLDPVPVVTEPFHDWVLQGSFPGGRPAWEGAGATFVDDIVPFEQRKLWLLNGGHSLLAYLGLRRGHTTAAGALADDVCATWLERWWDEAGPHLPFSADEVAAYRARLSDRLANPRIAHHLGQIAMDGSVKLPVRVLDVLRAERAAGRMPLGAASILSAWLVHLRQPAGGVVDSRADVVVPLAAGPLPVAARRVVGFLDAALADDEDLVATVAAMADRIDRTGAP